MACASTPIRQKPGSCRTSESSWIWARTCRRTRSTSRRAIEVLHLEPLAAEYDNMLRCIRCAACLTSCPTYVVTHKEEESPRGRIAIMRAMVEGHLDVTPDGVTHLDNCLLCEACTNVCPTGVQMEPMGIAFREALAGRAKRTKPLVARLAFGWLFGDL